MLLQWWVYPAASQPGAGGELVEQVHLFDEIVKVMPEGANLNSLKPSGPSLNLEGKAQSNARVSALMRNIDSSAWLASPKLQVIKKTSQKKSSDNDERSFELNAGQVSQAEENKQ